MNELFLDVDTQIDFLYPTGALAVPGAVQILPQLAALTAYAGERGIPVLSTCDAHLEDDREFATYRAHCVAGTLGAAKAQETMQRKSRRVAVGERLEGALEGQIVMEKRTTNMFAEPSIADLLGSIQPEQIVVYGVVTEICVMHAVQGLLRLGKPVTVVSDAIFALEESRARDLLNQWRAAGCQIAKTSTIVSTNGQPRR
ncbi:MAG: cysteine hydrolase [Bryobacterales bacterium]|nr:cysteine hydrolase [Bryobacterales bacterium]